MAVLCGRTPLFFNDKTSTVSSPFEARNLLHIPLEGVHGAYADARGIIIPIQKKTQIPGVRGRSRAKILSGALQISRTCVQV